MIVSLLLVFALAVLLVWYKQRTLFLTEYLFFVRIPLVLGLLLVFLPLYGPAIASDLLGNVFELDRMGTAVVTFSALLAMWSIAFTGRLIWISTPARCMLFLSREEQRRHREDDSLKRATEELRPNLLSPLNYIAAGVVLTGPLLFRLLSSAPKLEVLIGYGLGLAWAVVFLVAARNLRLEAPARWLLLPAAREMPEGVQRYHLSAAWFFLITAVVYVGFFVAGNPHVFPWTSEHMPAITYVYLLVMLVDWILSAASFQLDRARAPLFSVVLILLFCLQAVRPSKHLYKVVPLADSSAPAGARQENHAIGVLQRSWVNRNAPSRVCAIACSGGGIVASYWTAFVLEQLEREAAPPQGSFGDRVLMMSSVSGGGVGAMLYVDRFRPDRTPRSDMVEVRQQAGATSLGAAMWGLAYPDLARLALPFFPTYDRGWAIERIWGRRMRDPMTTLHDWLRGVEEGWRPLLVFNATHQETGERLLLAPTSMGSSTDRMRTSLAPGYDMRVTTAARLSATFPLVMPQARPEIDAAILGKGYHVADGGYYDNSGVVTLLETVQDFVQDSQHSPSGQPERIAILEIRASPSYSEEPEEDARAIKGPFANVSPSEGGFLNHLFGPLQTLFNVRTSSQSARNRFESRLFENSSNIQPVQMRTFVFQLGPNQPLSWHLTDDERGIIECHWPTMRQDVFDDVLQEATDGAERAQERLRWLRICREKNAEALRELQGFLYGD